MSANDESSLLEDEQTPSQPKSRPQSRGAVGGGRPKPTAEEQKQGDDALRQELANVRKVNETIEGLLESLQKAKANMKTVNTTVSAAGQLLNTWTRILSQTEHNQRLILDPSWQGASQDITDIEEEAQARQYAEQRREIEEQERKAAAAQKVEDDERRRAEASARASKTPTRARGRGVGRGSTVASTPASSNTSMLRAPSASRGRVSNIGRARGLRGKS